MAKGNNRIIANKGKVARHPEGTPTWKLMVEYYEQVAKDAQSMGRVLKACVYRKKAAKEFLKAGGFVINV